ncbi:MAG TPA: CAP domain-containing protein, partial [Nocardioidaceae bacterium]|nr:CAP domain-containing protein [Nocardioidaceae bacterium]
ACLARLAQQHAERLAAEQTLYHQDLGTVSSTCGTSTAGENVAMNHSGPSAMVGQWLDSPGHRANLLNSGFTLIGIGTARAGDGAWYGVQVFGAK